MADFHQTGEVATLHSLDRDGVARLEIEHAVCLDPEFDVWGLYGNEGWPARYLFDGRGILVDFHLGEGGYADLGRKGGEARKTQLGSEGYAQLGRKGGRRVAELIRRGKQPVNGEKTGDRR